MNTKIALVTGANSGIGKATTLGLLKAGYRVGMLCRNPEKAETAKAELIAESGNEQIDLFIADLSSTQEIRRVAEEIRSNYDHIDRLVNNAGMLPNSDREESEDGWELTFAINHMSYFTLTKELFPLLKKAESARVINVASEAHRSGTFDAENIQLTQGYNTFRAYGNSKLFNIMFAKELAKRTNGTNITSYSLHPGVVNTAFAKESKSFFATLFNLGRAFMISPSKGAETSLYLCLQNSIESLNGQYFVKKKPAKPSVKAAYDDKACKKLWEISEELLGGV